MNEWNDLHIKLSEVLGDPFQADGSPIAFNTDGIRYSKEYRSRLLNDALRWVMLNFDSVYLNQNGMPGGLITTEEGSITQKMMRLLSVELRTSSDEGVISTVSVPIITRTTKRLNRVHHSHWDSTPYAYMTDRYNVMLHNEGDGLPIFTYVVDFDDIDSDQELYVSKALQDYVVMRALVRDKVNSQKYQEGMYLDRTVTGSVQGTKQTIEQTKQMTYLK